MIFFQRILLGEMHGLAEHPATKEWKRTILPPRPPRSTERCLNALDRRFETTFSHMSRSMYTGSATGGHSTVNCKPACSIAERNTLAQVCLFIDSLYASGLDAGEIQ
jgi:hypothetical protein